MKRTHFGNSNREPVLVAETKPREVRDPEKAAGEADKMTFYSQLAMVGQRVRWKPEGKTSMVL